MWRALALNNRLDDKDSVDIHDHPPIPDNVLKEDDDKVRRPRSTAFDRNAANKPVTDSVNAASLTL